MDDDLRQSWQDIGQVLPDPARDILRGRILETGDVIEIVMIKLFEHRLECAFDIGEIGHPSELRVQLTADVDLHGIGMTMQPGTLVALRHVRQSVRCLDVKFLVDIHAFHLRAAL